MLYLSGYFWLDLDRVVYYSVLHDPLVHVVQISDLATAPCTFLLIHAGRVPWP